MIASTNIGLRRKAVEEYKVIKYCYSSDRYDEPADTMLPIARAALSPAWCTAKRFPEYDFFPFL
jgi:hypothetical protein